MKDDQETGQPYRYHDLFVFDLATVEADPVSRAQVDYLRSITCQRQGSKVAVIGGLKSNCL